MFSNWGVVAFTAITGFFLSPFVVNRLGDEAYGTWVLLGSLVGYLGLLDLGVRGAVMRFVARAHGANDRQAPARYASVGLFVFSLASVVAVIAGFLIAIVVGRFFDIPPHLLGDAQEAVMVVAMTLALSLISGVFGGVVVGLERFDLNGIAEIGLESCRVVAVVVALLGGQGILALAWIHFGVGLLKLVVFRAMCRWVYPELSLSLSGWSRADLRELLGFGFTTTFLRGADLVAAQIDAIVIGLFHPVSAITFFAIALNLSNYATQAAEAIAYAITPRVSALEGRGSLAEAARVPVVAAKLAMLVLLPIVTTYMIRGGTFIGLWMGPDYADKSGRVLLILSFPLWFFGCRTVLTAAVMGLNKHRVLIPVALREAAVNLGLSLVLVRSLGIEGVALGTAIPGTLFSALILPIVFARLLGLRPRDIWVGVFARTSVAMVPFALGTFAVERSLPAQSLLAFFLQVAAVLPLALGGSWSLGLTSAERSTVGQRLPARLQQLLGLRARASR